MTPQQYERLKELFHAALEIAPDERGAFLDQVSASDPDLRRELESLLSAREVVFTEKPRDDIAAGYMAQRGSSDGVPSLTPNTRIDRYRFARGSAKVAWVKLSGRRHAAPAQPSAKRSIATSSATRAPEISHSGR